MIIVILSPLFWGDRLVFSIEIKKTEVFSFKNVFVFQITNSGFCLSFTDATAQTLLQELDGDPGEGGQGVAAVRGNSAAGAVITGICYNVKIRKNDTPQKFSGNLIATKF